MPSDPDLPESITPMRDVRRFSVGETIFERGEAGRCLYIVTRGMVEIRQPADDGGAGLLLRHVEAGDCFGEIALLAGGTRTASAQATAEPTELAEIDKARFVYLVGQQPAFALTLMRSLARRLRSSDPRLADGSP